MQSPRRRQLRRDELAEALPKLFHMIDKNLDGHISRKEWTDAFYGFTVSVGPEDRITKAEWFKIRGDMKLFEIIAQGNAFIVKQDWMRAFDLLDVDNNGGISLEELSSISSKPEWKPNRRFSLEKKGPDDSRVLNIHGTTTTWAPTSPQPASPRKCRDGSEGFRRLSNGLEAASEVFCHKCGHVLTSNLRFCTQCGAEQHQDQALGDLDGSRRQLSDGLEAEQSPGDLDGLRRQLSNVLQAEQATFGKIEAGQTREDYRIALQDTNVSLQDLRHVRVIGAGTFSTVHMCEHRQTKVRYALKVAKKQPDGIEPPEMIRECAILRETDHPFILYFVCLLQTQKLICILTELVTGGDLHAAIRMFPPYLSRAQAQFYTASLVLAIEALWERNVVYRDLKPENVMLDAQGYIKLIDFGLSKKLLSPYRTHSMVGTPHYIAPEVLRGQGYGMAVDLWSLGVMLFEFVCGFLPFADELDDPAEVHTAVLKGALTFPRDFRDQQGKALIKSLLCRQPEKRLGAGGLALVRAHPYFSLGANEFPESLFGKIMDRELEPPLVPDGEKYCSEEVAEACALSDVMELWPPSAKEGDLDGSRRQLSNGFEDTQAASGLAGNPVRSPRGHDAAKRQPKAAGGRAASPARSPRGHDAAKARSRGKADYPGSEAAGGRAARPARSPRGHDASKGQRKECASDLAANTATLEAQLTAARRRLAELASAEADVDAQLAEASRGAQMLRDQEERLKRNLQSLSAMTMSRFY